MGAVIELARSRAADPADWANVWAALVDLAQSSDRPSPLLGYVAGEGVKYQRDNAVDEIGWLSPRHWESDRSEALARPNLVTNGRGRPIAPDCGQLRTTHRRITPYANRAKPCSTHPTGQTWKPQLNHDLAGVNPARLAAMEKKAGTFIALGDETRAAVDTATASLPPEPRTPDIEMLGVG